MMVIKNRYGDVEKYITKDGSEIRELMHPLQHGCKNQSLAEATILAGCETRLHRHEVTEEIYYILSGNGLKRLGDEQFAVVTGDVVCIAPTTAHNIRNTGDQVLVLLCCCSPAYSHDDTYIC